MLLRFSLTVWVLAALASLVASQAYPITGVQVAAGSAVPYRKNINILYKNGGAPWDLYLRSLEDLYAQDANNRLSYFQIAGIHGRPYIEWNNAGRRNTNGWQGYCPHGEALFLPWHRPYVLAFESRPPSGLPTSTPLGNFIVMKQPAQGLFYGKFSLDKAADPVELADTETKVVVSDLLAALRVQITKHDGTVQALESVPSFKLELENVDVTPPETDTELPEYTDAEKVTAPKEDLAAAPPS
ncbi:hypothetical protein BN1723_009591 [Verticillium longisporum]|uniref:Tyrosinase copper-binding domain-containing protein n=1 Tax=Verticillium longisporum TaxID=100787 RepID=A0A0G4KRK8_VERLO|nr:hypothetical protein BN1723_009591 [Verticillium longisporum]